MKRPSRIGITGGIGSGKSVVCRLFALWGAPVYDSDSRAKQLMDSKLVQPITGLLGARAYRDGSLDRAWVASRIFADGGLLAKMNAIVHPAVGEDFLQWADSHNDKPYVILESAILFSSGFDRFTDHTVGVYAPLDRRVERAMERSGCSREAVLARVANQTDEADRAEFTIDNHACALIPQVARMHEIFSGR